MSEVTAWYECLCDSAHLPLTQGVAVLQSVVQEAAQILALQGSEGLPLGARIQLLMHEQVPLHIAESCSAALRWVQAVVRGERPIEREFFRRACCTVAAWIEAVTGEPVPECLRGELFPIAPGGEQGERLDMRVTVQRVKTDGDKAPQVVGWRESGELVRVLLFPPWAELAPWLWRGATLGLIRVRAARRPGLWIAGETSLVVLEPDRLVDVTDVAAACRRGDSPWMWVARAFRSSDFSLATFSGWLLNLYFDYLLLFRELSWGAFLRRAFAARPLGFLLLDGLLSGAGAAGSVLEEVRRENEPVLRQVAGLLSQRAFLIEPAFIAPHYGMQGRVDVLVLDERGTPETLVELKTGAVPQRQAAWDEHRAQVLCYELILQEAFEQPPRRRWIFYCRDPHAPIRELPLKPKEFQWVLQQRNRRVWSEWQLMSGSTSLGDVLEALRSQPGGEELAAAYGSCTPEERAYVEELVRFLLREQWAQWQQFLIVEEATSAGIGGARSQVGLSDLELLSEASDWKRLHLCFRRTDEVAFLTALRPGDPVILFPQDAVKRTGRLASPVLKGSVRSLGERELWVSLRNKHVEPWWCQQWGRWRVQPDTSEHLLEAQWAALRDFLTSPPERRQRLLGMLPPRQRVQPVGELPPTLSPDQREVIEKALAAADYALLQGPPGTGKTRIVLRTLVELLIRQPGENLLIVAPTNRAVDEVCRVLQEAAQPFVRLGLKEVTEHPETTLGYAAERMAPQEFARWFGECRIVVGTVASVLVNPELKQLRRFTTLIVDEASQVLESQLIGLLCWAERALLIGDERQLPAVVVQPTASAAVRDERLRKLGFVSFAESLFERLLRQCAQNGWDYAYGMLCRQARMHELLQHFPSVAFYGGKLCTAGAAHQRQQRVAFPVAAATPLEELLSAHRLLFIDCLPDPEAYGYHQGEAQIVAHLVRALVRLWGAEAARGIGVIAPYRLQVYAIRQLLPSALRSVVTVDTVERFQGSERESIVISLAVNHPWELSFLQSLAQLPDGTVVDRRLNVMLTRARQQVILVGSSSVVRHSPLYRRLLAFVSTHGHYLRVEELATMLSVRSPLLP